MLISLECDKFKRAGEQRPPLVFHEGLNIIKGTANGDNSVGKSTLLLILDFVFGGHDYVDKEIETQEELGEQVYKFVFNFNGEEFYFSRSTKEKDIVCRCDENYQVKEKWTLNAYTVFLEEKYGLNYPGLTFRSAISRFLRIEKRETINENLPLKNAKSETDEKAIENLIALFNQHDLIAEQHSVSKDAKEEYDSFSKTVKHEHLLAAKNVTEKKKNLARIEMLEAEADLLAERSSLGMIDIEELKSERLVRFQEELRRLRRRLIELRGQLNTIREEEAFAKHKYTKDYAELLNYFPNSDIQQLEEIESFHNKLTGIMKKEFKNNAKEIENLIVLANSQVQSLEVEVKKTKEMQDASMEAMKAYAQMIMEIEELKTRNANFQEKERLKEVADCEAEKYNLLVVALASKIATKINTELQSLTREIHGELRFSPRLTIDSAKTYTYVTPKDTGTGSQDKGLVLFDLAILQLTNIPFVAHDSKIMQPIEYTTQDKLLEMYSGVRGKQVFLAFDKEAQLSDAAKAILKDKTVIELAKDEEALFGRCWNRR